MRVYIISRAHSDEQIEQTISSQIANCCRHEQMALDEPDFPDKSLADEVAFAIRGLKSDWEIFSTRCQAEEKMIPDV